MKILERFFEKMHSITCWVVCLLTLCMPPTAFSDDTLCINQGTPPTLDGAIDDDLGWLQASQYSFLNGSSGQHGRVQLSRNMSNIYLSFEIDKLPSFNANTQIILLLGPVAGDPTQDWRIHIKPGSDSGNGVNSLPLSIQGWKNSTNWTQQVNCEPASDATCSTPTSLVEAKVTAASSGSDNTYRVELRLSLGGTGIAIPSGATDIKLAFNALRVYQINSGGITETVADQLNWPTAAFIPGSVFPGIPPDPAPTDADIMQNPARADWGTAVLPSSGQACAGVHVKRNWINTPATTAELKPPVSGNPVTNKFFVEVENTGAAPAGHVLATISAWRFGSTPFSTLGKIGPPNGTVSPSNPIPSYTAADPSAIAAGASRTLVPMEWTLTSAEYQSLYSTGPYVCSVIQLDVDPAHVPAGVFRTQISSRYYPWNIHMAPASVFRNTALLETKGYDAPSNPNDPQRFMLQVSTREVASLNADEVRDIKQVMQSSQSSREVKSLTSHKYTEHGEGKFPRIPVKKALQLLEYMGGLSYYLEGAGFLTKTVCPYRHTGRYIYSDGGYVELMERATCFEYWIYHFGEIKEWINDLTVNSPFKLVNNGAGFYSIDVPVGASVELNTRIEAVEPSVITPDPQAWWHWMLIILAILLILLFLFWRKSKQS